MLIYYRIDKKKVKVWKEAVESIYYKRESIIIGSMLDKAIDFRLL